MVSGSGNAVPGGFVYAAASWKRTKMVMAPDDQKAFELLWIFLGPVRREAPGVAAHVGGIWLGLY